MTTSLIRKARAAWALLRLSEVAARFSVCPICGPTLVLRLARNSISVRCVRCGASAIHMSIVQVIGKLYPDLSGLTVYEMSSRGPVFDYLRSRVGRLVYSEYFDEIAPGAMKGNLQCQDVQRLTFADGSFDLCTSTEVFEHVPDDIKGFREIHRVLRPAGRLIFTVPLSDSPTTVKRAEVVNGELRYLMPPEYHGDFIRGWGKVLCFRNYGLDIVDRLRESGFRSARLMSVDRSQWWGLGPKVIVAEK